MAGLGGQIPAALGLPNEASYVVAYCRKRNIDVIANWDFYLAFGYFRLAAILHGIKGRVLRGTATSAMLRNGQLRFRAWHVLPAKRWSGAAPDCRPSIKSY